MHPHNLSNSESIEALDEERREKLSESAIVTKFSHLKMPIPILLVRLTGRECKKS